MGRGLSDVPAWRVVAAVNPLAFALALVLLGFVMTDGAADTGAEQSVMPGEMAGNPADDGTLYAARRYCRFGNGGARNSQGRGSH